MEIFLSILIWLFAIGLIIHSREKWRRQDAYLKHLESLVKKEPEYWVGIEAVNGK